MVSSTSTQTLSGMAEIAVDPTFLDIPPPLPPRLRYPKRPECLFGPSSSSAVQLRPMAVKCIDEYHVFPCTLDVPHSDFDANSVGFVDIQELRKLEESDCTSVISSPTPARKRPSKRRSFVSKLFLRCRTAPRGYGSNPLSTLVR
ncbi:hypothetical protein OESDEN_06910 [Oesophagostomum dentatum]|uniref:Uncharacterized protein n=1 Tax=Oesophagostomum dentatum TaxID=61180 RepID=A0A0B1T7I8_OESDE|nr:hypothetical protein OESDEN_06910 [Oesophagostomum dentatum]